MKKIKALIKDEEGATAVEYGLIVAAIAAVIVVIAFTVGRRVLSGFTTVDTNMAAEGMTDGAAP